MCVQGGQDGKIDGMKRYCDVVRSKRKNGRDFINISTDHMGLTPLI